MANSDVTPTIIAKNLTFSIFLMAQGGGDEKSCMGGRGHTSSADAAWNYLIQQIVQASFRGRFMLLPKDGGEPSGESGSSSIQPSRSNQEPRRTARERHWNSCHFRRIQWLRRRFARLPGKW